MLFLLGSEFLPELNEGSIYMRASMPSSISLDQSVKLANEIRAKLRKYPEVENVLSQTGRPNDGTDPTGFYNVEMLVKIYPQETWKSGLTKEQLIDKMAKDLSVFRVSTSDSPSLYPTMLKRLSAALKAR